MLEELGRELFAAESDLVDEMDDSVEFSLGGAGSGGSGAAKYDSVDFFDGADECFCGFGCWGGCGEDWFEIFLGLEYLFDCETATVVFHLGWVDVDERENVLDGPAFAVLVFGDEVGDFDSCA